MAQTKGGLIHIYCGDGKGKTTAAIGLAVRAAGAGKRVVIAQFFKNGNSSEVKALRQLGGIELLHSHTTPGRFCNMDEAAKAQARADYGRLLEQALTAAAGADMLILDEAVPAFRHGVIDRQRLLDFLQDDRQRPEVILTGRRPSAELLALADYVTEMRKQKHPFDRGVRARRSIEF